MLCQLEFIKMILTCSFIMYIYIYSNLPKLIVEFDLCITKWT